MSIKSVALNQIDEGDVAELSALTVDSGKTLADATYQPDQSAPWFQKYAGSSADKVQDFCKANDIVKDLNSAVDLAEKCFQTLPPDVSIAEDVDPETDDTKIVINLSVRNKSRQEVLASYRDFRRQLMSTMPVEKRALIRLSYDIS
jgi:hypothetical protein